MGRFAEYQETGVSFRGVSRPKETIGRAKAERVLIAPHGHQRLALVIPSPFTRTRAVNAVNPAWYLCVIHTAICTAIS